MVNTKFVKVTFDEKGVVELVLNRPEIHNAFNDQMISEIIQVVSALEKDDKCRLVVLSGMGKSFCAGADLSWMKQMKDYSKEKNVKDSLELSKMFKTLHLFSKPIIGKINGHALGGGVGLVSICDYAIVVESAKIGLTEVRLGLAPAVISPYVISKIGVSNARAYFLSGTKFGGRKAVGLGLAHECCESAELDERVESLVMSFLKAAPVAQRAAKNLIAEVSIMELPDKLEAVCASEEYTANLISELRVSDEGQEGMNAILSKRKANWDQKR